MCKGGLGGGGGDSGSHESHSLQVTERVDSQCSIPDAPNETEMRPTPPLTANRSKQVSHGKSKVWL